MKLFLRQILGMILFFGYLALYIYLAMSLGIYIGTNSQILMFVFYVIAGVAWVWPATKLLRIIR